MPKPSKDGNVSRASVLGRIVLFICLSKGDCHVEDHQLLKLDNNVEDLQEHGCVQETLLAEQWLAGPARHHHKSAGVVCNGGGETEAKQTHPGE
jgi:hypothetical protein